MRVVHGITGFQWDDGNRSKSVKKHGVTDEESEEAFFDEEKRVFRDVRHSLDEECHILIGKTRSGKKLFIVFTLRKNNIRIISSRKLNRKEHHLLYEKET